MLRSGFRGAEGAVHGYMPEAVSGTKMCACRGQCRERNRLPGFVSGKFRNTSEFASVGMPRLRGVPGRSWSAMGWQHRQSRFGRRCARRMRFVCISRSLLLPVCCRILPGRSIGSAGADGVLCGMPACLRMPQCSLQSGKKRCCRTVSSAAPLLREVPLYYSTGKPAMQEMPGGRPCGMHKREGFISTAGK